MKITMNAHGLSGYFSICGAPSADVDPAIEHYRPFLAHAPKFVQTDNHSALGCGREMLDGPESRRAAIK
jgi:hypothetical protein